MMRRPGVLLFVAAALALSAGACGGGDDEEAEQPPAAEQPETETAPAPDGQEAAAGRQIFEEQGCGGCHTLEAAGSSGTTGPNLDESLQGESREFIRESIVTPNAEIAEGFSQGVMPTDFGEKLSDQELDQLVDFLAQSTQ